MEGGRQRAKAEDDVASLWYFALVLLNDLIFDFDNENLSSYKDVEKQKDIR